MKLNMPVVAIKTMFFDSKTSTKCASKVTLKTNGMNWLNSNVQWCCDTESPGSLLTCIFVTGLDSSNFMLVTT